MLESKACAAMPGFSIMLLRVIPMSVAVVTNEINERGGIALWEMDLPVPFLCFLILP